MTNEERRMKVLTRFIPHPSPLIPSKGFNDSSFIFLRKMEIQNCRAFSVKDRECRTQSLVLQEGKAKMNHAYSEEARPRFFAQKKP